MNEHHITVPRTARFVTLGPQGGAVKEVWFACHGYGQLAANFAQNFSVIDDGTRRIVVPEALSRFYVDGSTGPHGPSAKIGATWMTREDRLAEIEDYVTYLDTLYDSVFAELDRAATSVVVLGFSQGVSTVARWLARGRARADRLILWGGSLPADALVSTSTGLRSPRLTLVLGSRDEFASEELIAAQREQLDKHGLVYELATFHGGHRLDDDTLRNVAATGER